MIAPTKLFELELWPVGGGQQETIEVSGELLNELCRAIEVQVQFRQAKRSRKTREVTLNSLMIVQLKNLRRFLAKFEDGEPSEDDAPMTKDQAVNLAQFNRTRYPGLHKIRPIPINGSAAWKIRIEVTDSFSVDVATPRAFDLAIRQVMSEAWQ